MQLASVDGRFMPLNGYASIRPSSPRKLSSEKQNVAKEKPETLPKVNRSALEILFPELAEEKTSSRQKRAGKGEIYRWPVAESLRQRISSLFGHRKDPFTGKRAFHKGVDIAASTGTKVIAAADGVVAEVTAHPRLGKYIKVVHDDETYTMYGHLGSVSVKKGKKVRAGEVLGKVGSTGRSTGPHLHFSLSKNEVAINPLPHLMLPDYIKAVEVSDARD